jgi:hypothetical protein
LPDTSDLAAVLKSSINARVLLTEIDKLEFHSEDANRPKPGDEFPSRVGLRQPVSRENGIWKRHPSVGQIRTPMWLPDSYADVEARPFLLRPNGGEGTERRDSGQQLD